MNSFQNQFKKRGSAMSKAFGGLMAVIAAVGLGLAPMQADAQVNIVWVSHNGDSDAPDQSVLDFGLLRAPDAGYTDLLEASGAMVTRVITLPGNPQEFTPEDLATINAADLVIVSRAVSSGGYQNDNATYWNTQVTAPCIFMSGYIVRSSRMGLMAGTALADTIGITTLQADDPSHPVFEGIGLDGSSVMNNPFASVVPLPNGELQRGISASLDALGGSTGNLIATVATDVNPEDETAVSGALGAVIIAEWDSGDTVTHDGGAGSDVLASKRMVFFSGSREQAGTPVPAAGEYDLFADGEQMFYNAVNYMAGLTGDAKLLPPPRVDNIMPVSGSLFVDPDTALTFEATSIADIPTDGITVLVNSVDVSGDLVIGGTPTARTVSYTGFDANNAYVIDITVANDTGSRSVSTAFDTFTEEGNIVIEAEDFNFANGGFFDNVVLCNDFGGEVDGCYFDRVSASGVDALDTLGFDDDDLNNVDNMYRFGAGFEKEEEVDTLASTDTPLRSKFTEAGDGANGPIRDYDVVSLNTGDWQNYTRTIEQGTYIGYLRVAATADSEVELGIVTSNPAQGNQTVNTIGSFVIGGGGGYKTIPLTAIGGTDPQAFQAGGVTTFRLSTINGNGGLRMNYFFLAPFSQSEIPTAIALQSPSDGDRFFVGTDVSVSAAATGPDGTAGSITQVEFFVDGSSIGVDSSAPFEATASGLEAGMHTITATATNSNAETVDSDPVTIEMRLEVEASFGTIAWVSFHPGDDEPSGAAASAGFTQAPDVGYTSLLESRGYKVERHITSGTPDAEALNAADLVIISRSVSSGNYSGDAATAWNGITAPMIVMGGYTLRTSRMGYTTGTTMVDTAETVSLNVADPSHPIFDGIALDGSNNTVNPFANIADFMGTTQRGVSLNTDPVNADGTVLATVSTATDPTVGGMVIGEWPAGSTMMHDGGAGTDILAGHRLVFLSGSREADGLTSEGSGIFDLEGDGQTMFLNAVEYMLHPEPYNVVFISFHEADDMPSADAAAAGFTEAADVGYTQLLADNGYNVTRVVTSGTPDAAVMNAADLVIISRSVPSSDYQNANASNWNAIEAPVLILGGYVTRNSRMGFTTGGTMVDTADTISLTASKPNHPIFLDVALDGNNTMVNPYANIVDFMGGTQLGISVNNDPLAADGVLIASISDTGAPAGGPIIAEWEAGVTMSNGSADTLAGPRVVFLTGSRESGITSQGAGIFDLDTDGSTMFLNAVRYTAGLGSPAGPVGGDSVFTAVTDNGDGTVTLEWTGDATLQSTAALSDNPVWAEVAGATSGTPVPVAGDTYFRLVP